MGPYLGMNPVAKNGNMILKIQFSSLIIMRMLASQRLEIAVLFYFQNIYIFGYQWFSKYLQRCLQKKYKIFTENLQNIYEMFAKM